MRFFAGAHGLQLSMCVLRFSPSIARAEFEFARWRHAPCAGRWRCCTGARRRDETSINTSVSPQPAVIQQQQTAKQALQGKRNNSKQQSKRYKANSTATATSALRPGTCNSGGAQTVKGDDGEGSSTQACNVHAPLPPSPPAYVPPPLSARNTSTYHPEPLSEHRIRAMRCRGRQGQRCGRILVRLLRIREQYKMTQGGWVGAHA